MIKIVIDHEKIEKYGEIIVRKLIAKRAYKGYVKYVEGGNETPLSFEEFSKFDFWKIDMSFRMYFSHFKNDLFSKDRMNFKSIIFNRA